MSDTTWNRISITRAISFVMLVTIIIVIGFLFYRVMANFLLPLFLAALLVVIFRPLHRRLFVKLGGRVRLAAGLTTAIILLIVLIPLGLVLFLAVSEGIELAANLDVRTAQQRLSRLREALGLGSPFADELRKIDQGLQELSQKIDEQPDLAPLVASKLLQRVNELETRLAQLYTAPVQNPEQTQDGAPISDDARGRAAELLDPLRTPLQQINTLPPGNLEVEHAIDEALIANRRIKQTLLGGATQSRLKELANPTDDQLRELRSKAFDVVQGGLATWAAATGAAGAKLVIGLAIMIISLYFFLADGPKMIESLMRLSPLDDQYEAELLAEFINISRAVVVATLLSALVQGTLAGLGFWAAGVNAVFLLSVLTAFFALIPFVGAASIWVPVCLWLVFFEERYLAAGLLALHGVLFISTSDNIVKAMVLHGQSRLHPLLALLSVLGGVAALGPIGILVGPMVVVFLQTLLNILQRELAEMDAQETATTPGGGEDDSALAPGAPEPAIGGSVAADGQEPTGAASPSAGATATLGDTSRAPQTGKRKRRTKR